MTMYVAYFDASGRPPDSVALFVSGFVASESKWKAFEEVWLRHLDAYEIVPPFHMTDFVSGNKQYHSWRKDNQQRQRFLETAVKIIKTHTRKPCSVGVLLADFDLVKQEYEMPLLPREPYGFCAAQVMMHVFRWAKRGIRIGKLKPDDMIECVFERGDLHQGRFIQYAEESFHTRPELRDKTECVPFQACDLLAWAHRRALVNTHGGDGQMPTGFAEIAQLLPQETNGRFHNLETLRAAAEDLGLIRKREGPDE